MDPRAQVSPLVFILAWLVFPSQSVTHWSSTSKSARALGNLWGSMKVLCFMYCQVSSDCVLKSFIQHTWEEWREKIHNYISYLQQYISFQFLRTIWLVYCVCIGTVLHYYLHYYLHLNKPCRSSFYSIQMQGFFPLWIVISAYASLYFSKNKNLFPLSKNFLDLPWTSPTAEGICTQAQIYLTKYSFAMMTFNTDINDQLHLGNNIVILIL